jgi:hypothetical protein
MVNGLDRPGNRSRSLPLLLLACLVWPGLPATAAGSGGPSAENLARPEYEAVPIMSSQIRDAKQEVENILDGDRSTRWTSEPGTFPNWIEIRWPQPVTLNRLCVDEHPSGRSAEYRVDVFVAGQWRTVAGPSLNHTPPGRTLVERFPPTLTPRIRFSMLSGAGGAQTSSISELQVWGWAPWIDAKKRLKRPAAVNGATFALFGWRASPGSVKPGGSARLEFDLGLTTATAGDYGFEITLGEPTQGSPMWGADYSVARTYARPAVKTSSWAAGRRYTVVADLYVPLWAPHGPMPIRLAPLGNGLLGRLDGGADGLAGQLDIRRFAVDPAPWPAVTPRSEIRLVGGEPRLHVDGRMVAPFVMTEETHPSYQGYGQSALAGIHLWRALGVKSVRDSYGTAAAEQENARWFQEIDQNAGAILRCDPAAYIIVCTGVRPDPLWTAAYPDDAALMSNGRRLEASLSSPRWTSQMQHDYAALAAHLMRSRYAGHVIAIHFEVALETQYPGSDSGFNGPATPRSEVVLGDYSPVHLAAFRDWLRARYGNRPAALAEAWRDPRVTFATARPDVDILRRQDFLVFKDPVRTRMPLDYWEFHNHTMARLVNEVGRAIKTASGGKYLSGLWGFYSNGVRTAGMAPGMQHFGFGELREVLGAPWVDYLVPLRAYAFVRWGTPFYTFNLRESIRRHGKMCLVECDDRTFYAGYRDMPLHSQQETLAVAQRNWAATGMHGDGLWWVGFGGVDYGQGADGRRGVPWYAEDSITANLARGNSVYRKLYAAGGSRSVAEVAVFMNNQDVYALDVVDGHRLLASCQYQTAYFELTRLGTPVDCFLLDDIALAGMDQYRVYVFLNANYLTAAQRALIKRVALRPGKTAVWLYAPGFCDGRRLSTANIADLTGFQVGCDPVSLRPEASLLPGHALTRNIPPGQRIYAHPWEFDTTPYAFGPVFHVTDGGAEPLAAYVHDPSKIAFAAKNVGPARSIYLGVPYLDSVVLRQICRTGGVHLYAQDDVYLDATENYLMITGGPLGYEGPVTLPRPSYVYDITHALAVGQRTSSLAVRVPANQSVIYYLAPDAKNNPFLGAD